MAESSLRIDPDRPYPMTLPQLGHAVIVNNVHSEMPGSQRDVEALEAAYEAAGFTVHTHRDCDTDDMEKLQEWILSENNHSDSNSFFLTALCHGNDKGHVTDRNRKEMWDTEGLMGDLSEVESLTGKPKILIIQTYGGSKCRSRSFPVPRDTYVAHAVAPPGGGGGSLFLQTLANFLQMAHTTQPLDGILRMVRQYMANELHDAMKQYPDERNNLIYQLHFSQLHLPGTSRNGKNTSEEPPLENHLPQEHPSGETPSLPSVEAPSSETLPAEPLSQTPPSEEPPSEEPSSRRHQTEESPLVEPTSGAPPSTESPSLEAPLEATPSQAPPPSAPPAYESVVSGIGSTDDPLVSEIHRQNLEIYHLRQQVDRLRLTAAVTAFPKAVFYKGHYTYTRRNTRGKQTEVFTACLVFYSDTSFGGFWSDEAGDFQFKNGNKSGAAWRFSKFYQTHVIEYQGRSEEGEQVKGTWHMRGCPQHNGTFQMAPLRQ